MQRPLGEFAEALASKEPAPGGGGASAYVGALAAALGAMVGSLTLGKKKYADVQDEIEALLAQSAALRERLQDLVAEDAAVFVPLSKAYGLPAGTDEEKRVKEETLEVALRAASDVPVAIMEASCEAIDLARLYAEKGSRLALSDAGVSALFAKAALAGAGLNVFINTKLMQDRAYAEALNEKTERMLAEYERKADDVYDLVRQGCR
ncbi:MAG: cyclodeaminase/cyclohydrolase family protein [Clostridiales Family XIII bacterium]|jgi:formiminotetrahydrofolate cyclodeaminase|nr:cyclodeaminase/cyclohydrolase family protein [Clostridiales Family XIII bacterium]